MRITIAMYMFLASCGPARGFQEDAGRDVATVQEAALDGPPEASGEALDGGQDAQAADAQEADVHVDGAMPTPDVQAEPPPDVVTDAPTGCTAPRTTCGGVCTDTHGGDINNCGACGTVCALSGASAAGGANPACRDATCIIGTCEPGAADCDRVYSNGCEVDTTRDPLNCGACGVACAPGQACSSGGCR